MIDVSVMFRKSIPRPSTCHVHPSFYVTFLRTAHAALHHGGLVLPILAVDPETFRPPDRLTGLGITPGPFQHVWRFSLRRHGTGQRLLAGQMGGASSS